MKHLLNAKTYFIMYSVRYVTILARIGYLNIDYIIEYHTLHAHAVSLFVCLKREKMHVLGHVYFKIKV